MSVPMFIFLISIIDFVSFSTCETSCLLAGIVQLTSWQNTALLSLSINTCISGFIACSDRLWDKKTSFIKNVLSNELFSTSWYVIPFSFMVFSAKLRAVKLLSQLMGNLFWFDPIVIISVPFSSKRSLSPYLSDKTLSGKSLIYIIYERGSMIEPWGTPLKILREFPFIPIEIRSPIVMKHFFCQ